MRYAGRESQGPGQRNKEIQIKQDNNAPKVYTALRCVAPVLLILKTIHCTMKKSLDLIIALWAACATLQAAVQPTGYYKNAEGKTKQALLTALYGIISNHTDVGYNGLWNAYKSTDVENGYYIDMYSNYPYKVGEKENNAYQNIGDCVNREHSFPQSWFGRRSPMKSDLFHVYPTDGYVNNQRSSFPFGECANGTRLTNGTYYGKGKLGTSTTPGYSGKVWEPDNEYKGDFARTYFYMATCYNNLIAGWAGNGSAGQILAGNSYPAYQDWYIAMLLRWNTLDPVSEKEIKRNNAAHDIQHNRNPFIDHPELAEYIWGNQMGNSWYENIATVPTILSPSNGSTIEVGTTFTGTPVSKTITVKAALLTQDLTVTVSGAGFTADASVISWANANAGTTITVTFNSDAATAAQGSITLSSSEVNCTAQLTATATATPMGAPVATQATRVKATSFQANWTAVEGAESYTLYVNTKDTAQVVTPVLLLDEDMSSGTTWSKGGNTYQESGYLRLGTNSGNGSVISPAIDLTASKGTATVIVTAKYYRNDNGSQMKVSLIDNTDKEPDSKTFDLTSSDAQCVATLTGNASSGNRVVIENVVMKKRVMLNHVQVYAGNAGTSASTRRAASETGDSTQRVISGITATNCAVNNLTRGGTFEYHVVAVKGGGQSPKSNVIEVTLNGSDTLPGDVDGNGLVDVSDVTNLINMILGTIATDMEVGDINANGNIDVSDVTALINIILGQ